MAAVHREQHLGVVCPRQIRLTYAVSTCDVTIGYEIAAA